MKEQGWVGQQSCSSTMSHPGLTELNWLPPVMPCTSSTVWWASYVLVLVWWKPLPIGDRYTTYVHTCVRLHSVSILAFYIVQVHVFILAIHIVRMYVYITDNTPYIRVFVCVLVRTVLLWSVVPIRNQCTKLYHCLSRAVFRNFFKRSKVKVWRNKRGQS